MAKVNFRHQKQQKELARKARQSKRLARRSGPPTDGASAALAGPPRAPDDSST